MTDERPAKRMLNFREAVEYTSLKRASLEAFAESIGAVRRYGKRKMYDREVIDRAFDNSKPGENLKKEG